MRVWLGISIFALSLGFAGCNRDDRREPVARQVGREAYKVKEESKRAAKELGHELKSAGKEARQGWNEAKHEAPPAHKK